MSIEHEKLRGWDEIAKFLRRPESTIRSWAQDLEKTGVIFKELHGFPPRLMVCAYKDDLKEWDKSKQNHEARYENDS